MLSLLNPQIISVVTSKNLWFTNGWYYFWDKCVGTFRAIVIDCMIDTLKFVVLESSAVARCKITLLYSLMLSIYNYCCC